MLRNFAASRLNLMPTATHRPIEVQDLDYWINKVIVSPGVEWVHKCHVKIMPSAGMPVFFMALPFDYGQMLRMRAGGRRITQVCYQVEHKPTREVSPIYDHKFTANPLVLASDTEILLSRMKLYPAERVWPELTRQGYYGELPQFFT